MAIVSWLPDCFHYWHLISFQGFTEPSSDKLLPDLHPMEQNAFTLVLDLNETLIYSDWKVNGYFT